VWKRDSNENPALKRSLLVRVYPSKVVKADPAASRTREEILREASALALVGSPFLV
jgi:hypothetical protein